LTTEILYCARCRRVIRPREITEGKYHFADGEPVCVDCFTRLSRRLRPVSGIYEPPKPVDLSDIPVETPAAASPPPAAGTGAGQGPAASGGAQPAAGTLPARRSDRGAMADVAAPAGAHLAAKVLVLLAFALAGMLAGAGVYMVLKGPGAGKPPEAAEARPPAAGAVR